MAVVPEAGKPLSPQAADLIFRIARGILDEPAARDRDGVADGVRQVRREALT
jgi:hypothetical protein